jgi:hypothetical protein
VLERGLFVFWLGKIYKNSRTNKQSKEKNLDIHVVKLETKSNNLITCCIEIAASGNIYQFLELLDIINYTYSN